MSQTQREIVVGAAYALWFLFLEVVFPYQGKDVLQNAVLVGLVPAAIQVLLVGVNPYGLYTPTIWAISLLLLLIVGLLMNGLPDLYSVGEVVFLFAISLTVAGAPGAVIGYMAAIYAIPSAAFLLYTDLHGTYQWGRLMANGLPPNWWGGMGEVLIVTALAIRSRILMGGCMLIGLKVILDSGHRGALVAITVTAVVLASFYLSRLKGSRLMTVVSVAALGMALLVIFQPTVFHILSTQISSTFRLDDPNSGLTSGVTGRDVLWQNTARLWLDSPFFGVGFNQDAAALNDPGAHNAVLMLLADLGTFGGLWYVAITLAAALAAARIPNPKIRNLVLAAIVSYTVEGMTESRGIHTGNSFSLFFWFCCFYALAQGQWQKAIRATPGAAQYLQQLAGKGRAVP
jgi:O-antigen ligase